MSQKYLYISENVFTAVGDYQGGAAVEVNLPLEGTSKSLKPVVRMTPDNPRILASELLQAADRLDGGRSYLPNGRNRTFYRDTGNLNSWFKHKNSPIIHTISNDRSN